MSDFILSLQEEPVRFNLQLEPEPSLQCAVIPYFPGSVAAGAGITVSLVGNTYTIGVDIASVLAGYQPIDGDLTAIAGLTGTGIVRRTGASTWSTGTTVAVPEGGTGQTTEAAAVGALISALTEDTAPDNANDFLGSYDASATTGKKLRLSTIVREKLAATRTYYVRSTDGSDANTGLVDNAAGAFLTIQKAMDVAAALDTTIFNVTIQVRNGTYTGAVTLKDPVGAGTVTIVGDTTTPSNVIVSTTAATAFTANKTQRVNVSGIKVQTTTSGFGFLVFNGAKLSLTSIDFGTIAAGSSGLFATDAGTHVVLGGANCKWSGNCDRLISLNNQTNFNFNGTITLLANITVASDTIGVNGLSFVQSTGTWTLGAFTVTGTRFNNINKSLIQTFGAGINYFPGSVAGTTDATSTYL